MPKSGKVRAVPMIDQVLRERDALSRRDRFVDDDDLVFISPTGEHLEDSALRRRFYAALKQAKIKHLRFHDLRHSFGTLAVQVFPLSDVKAYMGHAVVELAMAVKSKEERKAIFNAVDKLRQLGEQLAPPHMKPLKGHEAAGLRELRPRQGRSDWRPLYIRRSRGYVILAIDRHDNFDALVARAQRRAAQYDEPT